jgi:pimeloyl-ACP methyl ester carboxylesterase
MRQDEPIKQHFEIDGVKLNVYEWAGSGDPLVLFHATGFHGRCWDYIVRRLPADTHVYALDCPGHGLSESPNMPFTWDDLSTDMAQVIERLNINNASLVGHSFGGYAATMVAAKLPERFKQVLLLDPVIVDPALLEVIESLSNTEHPVAHRRNEWNSTEEMIESFTKRAPYNNWHPQVLRDYCQHGLVAKDGESILELACPPLVEAEIYVLTDCGNAYTEAAKVTAPVHILRARERREEDSLFDFAPSPTWAELYTRYPQATDIHLKNMTHFFPMENPDELGALLNHWLKDGSVVWPE